MDLLTPWKMCLQCLPVFSPQPLLPAPLSAVPLRDASKLKKGASTAENDFQEAEKPSFSDASLTPDHHQHQDLPLSDYAKDVSGLPDYASPVETHVAANGDVQKLADQDISNPVVSSTAAQALQDDGDESTPPPSPVTHTPLGLGSILGHHRPLHHIHHQGLSVIHSHGHAKASPRPPISDLTLNDGRADPPVSISQSEDDSRDKEAARTDTDSAPSHPQSIPPHVQDLQIPTPALETFHSTRADVEVAANTPDSTHEDENLHGAYEDENQHGACKDEDLSMIGSSSASETSQTDLIDGAGTPLMRRRDQFKKQFKSLRDQLKQGGQQLRKEGTKHLQHMMSGRKKQGQANEESGSFSRVPRNPRPD